MIQEFVEEVRKQSKKLINEIHTAFPAQVKSYNPDTGLAVVSPLIKFRKPEGDLVNYPDISGVPTMYQKTGKITVVCPVKIGDIGLVLCSEESLDLWMYGKETDTVLKHDLTNAVFLPNALCSGNNSMKKACSQDAVVVTNGETEITITDGQVDIITKKVTVNANETIITSPKTDIIGNTRIYGTLNVMSNTGGASHVGIVGKIDVEGNIDVTDDVQASGISLNSHTHGGVETGGGSTGGPQ